MASPEGYEIREGDGFATQARMLLGTMQRWDEIRRGLDWALNRNPTHPSFATHMAANVWMTQIAGPPEMAIIYEVDEAERVVTYVAVLESL